MNSSLTLVFPPPPRWTGSNTNPNNNDGQGRAGTDRSNMVLLREQVYDEGMPEEGKMGHWGRSYPQHLDHENTFLGFSREDRQALAVLDNSEWTMGHVVVTVAL